MNPLKKLLLMGPHVCPWWLAYTFDNRLRGWVQDVEKDLGPYVKPGMTVVDIGCGMGFCSIGMARLVGDKGAVWAVDLQPQMLEVLTRRAQKAGVAHWIHTHLCQPDRLGVTGPFDFALTFAVVHEVPDRKGLFAQIFSILRPGGKYLLVEPKGHVSRARFEATVADCAAAGFTRQDGPKIFFSRSAVLAKP